MKKFYFIAIIVILAIAAGIFYRIRPITLCQSYSPAKNYIKYIKIVEIPRTNSLSNFISSIFWRDDPLYRFELYSSGILWSAATYNSSSYKAQKASVTWKSPGEAIAYLDNSPTFTMVGNLWKKDD